MCLRKHYRKVSVLSEKWNVCPLGFMRLATALLIQCSGVSPVTVVVVHKILDKIIESINFVPKLMFLQIGD